MQLQTTQRLCPNAEDVTNRLGLHWPPPEQSRHYCRQMDDNALGQKPGDHLDSADAPKPVPVAEHCSCFNFARAQVPAPRVRFHGKRQDTSAPGWLHLLDLIEEAAADGREVFAPLVEMTPEERRQVITLPPSIGKLTAVKDLALYRSNLVRLPPEIGAMASLEMFDPYTSPRLHWFPYELTRCKNLRDSRVSTRRIFGNYKYRPPFPQLREGPVPGDGLEPGQCGADSISSCSVCAGPITERGVHQVWLSAWIATDVLPLLVNACSDACVAALPPGANGYIRDPHHGGPSVVQPEAKYSPPRPL